MTSPGRNGSAPFELNPQTLDLLPVGVCICDTEGGMRYYNRRAAELWGCEPNDDVVRFDGFARIFAPDGAPADCATGAMAQAIQTGMPQRNCAFTGERRDGSRITVLANVDPLTDDSGKTVGAVSSFQGISEEGQLLVQPRRDESPHRDVVSALPVAVYATDREGYITLFNDAAAELWGRRPEIGKDQWCGSFRIFQPDGTALPLDACPMAVALREGRRVRGQEIVVERPDGLRRHVLPHPEPLYDDSGEIVGAVNMLLDITEQKQADAQRRHSDARFQAIVEATPECVELVSHDGTLLEMNAAGLAMIEADQVEDVIGRCVYDFVAPEHRDTFRAFNERVCRGERGCLEFDIVGLRGTRRAMESTAVPLPDDDGRYLRLGITRDITGRRQTELVRNLLAAIVESSDDAIVSKDLNGVITSWNKGAERLFGYTADEIIGKPVSTLVPPGNIEDTTKILSKIRRGERVEHYETKRKTKDGRLLDVSLSVSPVRDATGKIVGASKVGRDITAQKRAVEALRANEEQLRQVNRRKDEFLAMLAHELRNPLAAISSAVQVARRSTLDEPLEWSTEVIERQVKHLSRLIDDLLDVSRITRGKIQLRKEVLDIGPILNSAVDTVRPLIEERKHELNVSFRPGVLRVKADPVRLEQVVMNLLTNAAKYTEAGGRIWLTAEQADSDIVIRVRDTGMGILPEKLSQIFELFVQGDRALARSEGGLGIGLTLVKSLVEMQQGTISATSEGPGKGSEFSVRFPAVYDPIPEPTKRAPVVSNGRRASRILIVDDNADSARGLARLLKLLGHEVRAAHDGLEALEVARAYRPDVVLLDIGLPGMDGYEVAKQLRKDPSYKNSLIVAISGYGQEDDRRRTREAGFDYHLVKPIDHDTLLTLLYKS